MQIKGLSATGIKDYLQCKLKAFFRYDRDISSIKNDNMKVGTAVHEALEKFTIRMQEKKSFPDDSDYEYATNVFMDTATSEGLESMEFYEDGRIMVSEFIDRYDPAEEIVSVEGFFEIVTPEGVPLRGAIDKVIKINDDTIAIIDYKTARNALTTWELKDDIQLSMYDLAASVMWPEYKNRILILEYVRINKQVDTYRTEEDRENYRKFLSSMWDKMKNLTEEDAIPSYNKFCGWCDYSSYCPKYASLVFDRLVLPSATELTDGEFLDQWEELSAKKSMIDARQRELKMMASKRFMNGDSINGNGKELYSTQASRTNYDVSKVARVIPQEDLYPLLAVNKGRIDRYVKDYPDLKISLDRIAEVNYNAPVYRTRATREDENADPVSIEQDENAA